MAKVTSKLQVTIPKVIAVAHGIEPGAELIFESAGDVIRVRLAKRQAPTPDTTRERLAAFDEATTRQKARDRALRRDHPELFKRPKRGWRREELYDRGLPR